MAIVSLKYMYNIHILGYIVYTVYSIYVVYIVLRGQIISLLRKNGMENFFQSGSNSLCFFSFYFYVAGGAILASQRYLILRQRR